MSIHHAARVDLRIRQGSCHRRRAIRSDYWCQFTFC